MKKCYWASCSPVFPHLTFQWICSILIEGKLHNYLFYSNMLKLGSSKPWPDALEAICGTRQMSADALLEYFQPLMDWLKEENQRNGVTIGWEEECPEGFVPDNSSQSFVSYLLLFLLNLCHYAFLEWVNAMAHTLVKRTSENISRLLHKATNDLISNHLWEKNLYIDSLVLSFNKLLFWFYSFWKQNVFVYNYFLVCFKGIFKRR